VNTNHQPNPTSDKDGERGDGGLARMLFILSFSLGITIGAFKTDASFLHPVLILLTAVGASTYAIWSFIRERSALKEEGVTPATKTALHHEQDEEQGTPAAEAVSDDEVEEEEALASQENEQRQAEGSEQEASSDSHSEGHTPEGLEAQLSESASARKIASELPTIDTPAVSNGIEATTEPRTAVDRSGRRELVLSEPPPAQVAEAEPEPPSPSLAEKSTEPEPSSQEGPVGTKGGSPKQLVLDL
jgi:hypothetical protein